MLSKFKVNLLLLLSTTTLVGVGFSSWVIIGGTGATEMHKNSDVIVDSVGFSSRYITIDSSKGRFDGKDIFDYFTDGFRNEDQSPTTTASIIFYLKINLDNCYIDFDKNFKVNTELKYESEEVTNFDFIASTSRLIDTSIDSSIMDDPDNNRTINIQDKGNDYHNLKYSSTYSILDTYLSNNINNTLDTIEYTITYTFTLLPSISDFENQVYPYLINSKFRFLLNLEEVDG